MIFLIAIQLNQNGLLLKLWKNLRKIVNTVKSMLLWNVRAVQNKNVILLFYPHQVKKGSIKSRKRQLKQILPESVTSQMCYTDRKPRSCFNNKHEIIFEHQHDLVYLGKCPEVDCLDSYIDRIGRHISERINDHSGRDTRVSSF